MKILFVSPYLPHPRSGHGGGVYLYKFIEHLSVKHQIALLSFCDDQELELAKDLSKLPIRFYPIKRSKGKQKNLSGNILLAVLRVFQLWRSFLLWIPFYVSKYHHPWMAAMVKKLTLEESFDIVQIEYTQMAQYEKIVHRGKTILHEIDVILRPAYHRFKHARSIIKKGVQYIEWCRWARYEKQLASTFDHVLTITEQDRMLLAWMTKMNHISYSAHPIEFPEQIPAYESRDKFHLIFVGSFVHPANLDAVGWLCNDIFPLIVNRFPETKLSIIGPHPPASLIAMSRKYPGIQILGFVDDVDVYLRRGTVSIAPMRLGGGVKTKVLYAMAQGIPVVATRVAVNGIDGFQQTDALLGETPEQLAKLVCDLFADPKRAELIGMNGRNLVKQWYSWDSALENLERIYNRVLESSDHSR